MSRVIDEAGNAIGGSGVEVRVYDDFAASSATVVTADSAGATTITQPITPNAGTQTTLTVTTAAGDTTITVASTTGFAVGQIVPIFDGTTTKYRWITAILAGPPRLTLESAIGTVFSSTNTSVGNPDMQGVVGGYVSDSTFHYIQTKDVASTRVMPPTLLPTMIGIQSLAILEEGAAAGTRPTLNFISPFITAADNAPSTRVDVTGPTAAGVAALTYASATGTATTVNRSDHQHGIALTTAQTVLAADVTIAVANTWYDGPTVSLVAGTWLVSADLNLQYAGAGDYTARISDGTTHYASAGTGIINSTRQSMAVIITLGSTTTIKAQATNTSIAGVPKILAAAVNNGAGNNASIISAVRIA